MHLRNIFTRHLFIPFLIGIPVILLLGCRASNDDQRWVLSETGSTAVGLSRDAQFALSYNNAEKSLQLWDISTNQMLSDFGEHDKNKTDVSYIKISDNNRYAISATQINFSVWDLGMNKSEGLWSVSDGLITDVDISSNGRQVALSMTNGKSLYIDLDTGRRLEFLAHHNKVNTISISANGKFVISGGNDSFAYLWSTESGQILRTFPMNNRVVQVALQRNGRYAFTSDGINGSLIWDLDSGDILTKLQTWSRQQSFSAARFNDTGRYLITGSPSGEVVLWDSFTGEKLNDWQSDTSNIRPPSAVIYDVAYDNKLERTLSAGSTGIVQAWK